MSGSDGLRWWWLSFCDADRPEGQQFLGVCLVRAGDVVSASGDAWRLGCNPGGEVDAYGLSPEFQPDPACVHRLMGREEAEALAAIVF